MTSYNKKQNNINSKKNFYIAIKIKYKMKWNGQKYTN